MGWRVTFRFSTFRRVLWYFRDANTGHTNTSDTLAVFSRSLVGFGGLGVLFSVRCGSRMKWETSRLGDCDPVVRFCEE